jgi:hypothetical protein
MCGLPSRKTVLSWLCNNYPFDTWDNFVDEAIIHIAGDEVGLTEFERRNSLLAGQSSFGSAAKSFNIAARMSICWLILFWLLSLALSALFMYVCHSVFALVFFGSARNWAYLLGVGKLYSYCIVWICMILTILAGFYLVIIACLLWECIARGPGQVADPYFREEDGQLLLVV